LTITQVQIKHVNTDAAKKVKALLSVVIDNAMVMHDIRVIEKTLEDGTITKYVAFPAKQILTPNNEQAQTKSNPSFYNIYHPINTETRKMFEKAIFEAIENYTQTN